MDVIKRTLTRAVLHSEAKITVVREWSNKIHKEGIKVVANWIFTLALESLARSYVAHKAAAGNSSGRQLSVCCAVIDPRDQTEHRTACEILVRAQFKEARMRQLWKLPFLLSASLWLSAHAGAQTDSSPHKVQMIAVAQGVQLEVLDWGGSGRPLIFLAGAGDTAHRFDNFAPQLTKQHHVYGITRRGSGASSQPAPANGSYSADHLGDDILAVMKALHIERPVLVGHSMAGEELSSIGSRFPERVAGLVYLDAATGFAFYDPTHPLIALEMNDIKRRIDEIEAGGVDEKKKLLELETAVIHFETVLHRDNAEVANMPPLPPRSPIGAALNFGMQKYTNIPVPALAIYACPHNWDRLPDDARKAALIADDKARCTEWADNFRHGVPSAHIVMIPNADHYLYLSNKAQVVAEMNEFLATLH
jgi:non-heme chloroperoxidase